jgi:hypothetical protein
MTTGEATDASKRSPGLALFELIVWSTVTAITVPEFRTTGSGGDR